jgi:hypothetical protein
MWFVEFDGSGLLAEDTYCYEVEVSDLSITDDGTQLNSWALDPANGNAFCMANGGTYAHVNDFSNSNVYFFRWFNMGHLY